MEMPPLPVEVWKLVMIEFGKGERVETKELYEERCELMRVCKSWYPMILDNLFIGRWLSENIPKPHLIRLPHFKKLVFNAGEKIDHSFIYEMTQLESLILPYDYVADFNLLKKLTNLKSLQVDITQYKGEGPEDVINYHLIVTFTHLESLRIYFPRKLSFSLLGQFTFLKEFSLSFYLPNIEVKLPTFTNLTHLNLNRAHNIDSSPLPLPLLKKLFIYSSFVNDDYFSLLTNLSMLTINKCPFISDKVFHYITQLSLLELDSPGRIGGHSSWKLPNLTNLRLINTQELTNDIFLNLNQLKIIFVLDCQQITKPVITNCVSLRELYFYDILDGSSISDEVLGGLKTFHVRNTVSPEVLKKMTSLETLHTDCYPDNVLVDAIGNLTSLKNLVINNFQSESEEVLLKLTNLVHLSITGGKKISTTTIRKLPLLRTIRLGDKMNDRLMSPSEYLEEHYSGIELFPEKPLFAYHNCKLL